jgi:asparagine synthase (glutamine-hydrolysing)
MCGLLYFKTADLQPNDARVARAMGLIGKRGPDAQAVYSGNGYVLGHTRLAIIDTSAAANQPFWDASGRYVLAFNGEIYNYAELRQQLLNEGVNLRTNSDTETLLELLIRRGWQRTLAAVRGMFAFIMVDTETGEVLAARDHFGQKPLHYSGHGRDLAIGSDALSVCELIGRKQPRLQAYSIYLSPRSGAGTFGMMEPDRTFFEGVESLPAGHVLLAKGEQVKIERYFAPVDLYSEDRARALADVSLDEAVDELRSLYRQAARRHLVSDVPVGILLSGGIDSSLVHWYATEGGASLTSFTKISPGIEQIPLSVVPELLKRRPTNAYFGLQSPKSYLSALHEFIASAAAPSRWGGGPPMNSLCVEARRSGIVVLLGGDCADEYFGGYEHYRRLFDKADENDLGDLVSLDHSSPFYRRDHSEAFEAHQTQLRHEITQKLDKTLPPAERYAQATLLHDTTSFLQSCNLPHSDAYSMQTSVELRNPLLDIDLVGFAVNLPNRFRGAQHSSGQFGKVLMRELAARDIGDFVQVKKEGTRNFAMAAADPSFWRFDRFQSLPLLGLDRADLAGTLDKRQIVRLYNLELFHRQFFGEARDEPWQSLLTPAGLEFCRSGSAGSAIH